MDLVIYYVYYDVSIRGEIVRSRYIYFRPNFHRRNVRSIHKYISESEMRVGIAD